MEEEHPFPCRSRRIALKPPLPPEVTSSRRRRHRSTETSTFSTFGEASSSHIPESAQVVSTHLYCCQDGVITATHGHDPSNQ